MPPLHACPPARRSTDRSWGALLASLALGLALSACTSAGGEGDERSRGKDGPSEAVTTLDVRTTVARVAGELPGRERARIERQVGRLLERYLSAAYLHERPGAGYRGSFPGFTRGARALALEDVDTASDGTLREADDVRPRAAVAFVSTVAPEGRAVGATARVFLDLYVVEGDRRRLVEVRGRLFLTPADAGWRIFGYDLTLAEGKKGTRK